VRAARTETPGIGPPHRAVARLRQDLADDVGVKLRPVRRASQLPAVHDIADQVEIVALVAVEEREQGVGGALARPQVDVADPDRPAPHLAHGRTVWTAHGRRAPIKKSLPVDGVAISAGERNVTG